MREAEEGRVSRFDMRRRPTLPPFTFLVRGWVVYMVVWGIKAKVKENKHQVRKRSIKAAQINIIVGRLTQFQISSFQDGD